MKLSPAERETIILFSDADDTASVYTYDRRLIKSWTPFAENVRKKCMRRKHAPLPVRKAILCRKAAFPSASRFPERGVRRQAGAQRRPAPSRRTEAKAAIRMNKAGRWTQGFGSAPCFPERMVYGRKTEQPGQAEGDHGEY